MASTSVSTLYSSLFCHSHIHSQCWNNRTCFRHPMSWRIRASSSAASGVDLSILESAISKVSLLFTEICFSTFIFLHAGFSYCGLLVHFTDINGKIVVIWGVFTNFCFHFLILDKMWALNWSDFSLLEKLLTIMRIHIRTDGKLAFLKPIQSEIFAEFFLECSAL